MDTLNFAWGVIFLVAGLIAAGFFIAFVYVAVRAGAIAWFRTKREYLRDYVKHLGKNGELM